MLRRWIKVQGLALALLGMFGLISTAKADPAAEAYIQGLANEVQAIYATDLSDDQKRSQLGGLVREHVDLNRVGLFVLGPNARQISPELRREYLQAFSGYATNLYVTQLANVAHETLQVTGSLDRSARDVIVDSEVVSDTENEGLVVSWRVRIKDGAHSIIDVGAAELWLAVEQRAQFTSVIANNGGGESGVRALLEEF